jgi:hypothetical protein
MGWIRNIAVPQKATQSEALQAGHKAVWQKIVNFDDMQALRRVATCIKNGLQVGKPPGNAGK